MFYGQFRLKDRECNPQKRRPRNLLPTEPWAPASEAGVGSDFQSLQRSGICSLLRTPPGVHARQRGSTLRAAQLLIHVPESRQPKFLCKESLTAAIPQPAQADAQAIPPDHTWAKEKKKTRQLPLPATVNTAAQEKDRKKGTKEPRPGTNMRGSERQSLVQGIKIKGTDAPNSPRASRPTIHLKTQMGTYSGAGEVAQQVKVPSSSLNNPSLFPEPTKIKRESQLLTPASCPLTYTHLHPTPHPHPTEVNKCNF